MRNQDKNPMKDDLFGLGIQVKKIQAKRQPPKPPMKKNTSMKQTSVEQKKSGNTTFKANEKKLATPRPNFNIPKPSSLQAPSSRAPNNISSKKKIQRPVSSSKRAQSIKQSNKYIQKTSVPLKGLKNLNQSAQQKKDQNQENLEKKQQVIHKRCWIESLQELTDFYCKENEYEENKLTKLGRKKNQDYLQANESNTFVQAYCNSQQTSLRNDEFPHEYEQFQIENFDPRTGFSFNNFEQSEFETAH